MNKKTINRIAGLLLALCSLPAFWSCNDNEHEAFVMEADGSHTCRLEWEGGIADFGSGTRAVRSPQNGDCVLLRFKAGSDYVNGKAVYKAELRSWELTYKGSLITGATSACEAYFLYNLSPAEGSSTVALSHETPLCRDLSATYSKENDVVRLSARLMPLTGRIRFKGESGKAFLFSGVQCPSAFDTGTFALTMSEPALDVQVGSEGYTPYVYALPAAERTLSIYYDNQTYKTACESPILEAGRSGYMLLPTDAEHNGWQQTKLELPTVSASALTSLSDIIAEVSATVTSLGNGTLLDAGFVYAATPSPTLKSNKISCGAVEALAAVLEGLTAETDYYVRAYATNEMGTAYGEELCFKTTAAPTVPTVRTIAVMSIKTTTAEAMGTIDDIGVNSNILKHGHVWGTSPNPTLGNSFSDLGEASKAGDFVSALTNLNPHTTYYVRAYATNAMGTAYGEQKSFTTQYGSIRLTTEIASVRHDGAVITTNITETGGYTIAERGICWSTSATPTVKDNKMASASADRVFASQITGLAEQSTYYARSYLITEDDGKTVYGNIVEFTTPLKDGQFERDEYDPVDEDWSKGSALTDSEINKDEFEGETDFNKGNALPDSTIVKDDFEADTDFNKGSSVSGTEIGKDDFGDDEKWN